MHFLSPGGALSLQRVKRPNVAGTFYPEDPGDLGREIDRYLAAGAASAPAPKALIAPHAGYRYSGPIAGSAYARLAPRAGTVERVVLLGPAHYVAVRGVAVCGAELFETPLGAIAVDSQSIERALAFPFVHRVDAAFEREHSLEVHLPFLIRALGRFRLVPLLVGDAQPQDVDRLLDALWGGAETAVVISSDLSHYHDYETARRMDGATSRAIEALDSDAIGHEDACGRHAVNGLLQLARRRGIEAHAIDVRNSGDTAGPKDRVVGYGAYEFVEPPEQRLAYADRRMLLGVAASSIRHGLEQGGSKPVEPERHAPALRERRASFVTIQLEGRLRGCIGSVAATRTLVEDVAHNAHAAAFADPRFEPVTGAEADRLEISISVLGRPEPLAVDSEDDLVARLRPGIDGLILEDGARRGTYLPSVWGSIPDPRTFVRELKKKAGWHADHWSPEIRVLRYTTESFS